jgi:hypothetical protein
MAKEVNNETRSKPLREFRRDVSPLSAGFVLIGSSHNWLERSGSAGGAGKVMPQSLDMGQASGEETQTHLLELPDTPAFLELAFRAGSNSGSINRL